ncbi:MAG TPA: hydrogenase 2 operon protein HybA [Vicinamibacterales bacterium]|nr:hydrogenase 2 operon protein HybA [Vicinamibacterales bacterium]
MGISRRAALKGLALGGAVAAGARPAKAAVLPVAPPDAVGLLYDATMCIGCKTCMVACNDANGLAADTSYSPAALYHKPLDLNAHAKTVIKLYRDGNEQSFFKAQCMHCIDPACTNACMLGALKKREFGIVSYDADYCIGCRYCEVACPFGVPKFEWSSAQPKIVKCELCKERLASGKEPACTTVCPRKAVIFGKRSELLKEAKRRIAESPQRYVPKVYGETDGGGTQNLYLSHIPFEKLGLPTLGDEPAPQLARSIQHTVYKNFAAPVALYGVLGVVMWRNRKSQQQESDDAAR